MARIPVEEIYNGEKYDVMSAAIPRAMTFNGNTTVLAAFPYEPR